MPLVVWKGSRADARGAEPLVLRDTRPARLCHAAAQLGAATRESIAHPCIRVLTELTIVRAARARLERLLCTGTGTGTATAGLLRALAARARLMRPLRRRNAKHKKGVNLSNASKFHRAPKAAMSL